MAGSLEKRGKDSWRLVVSCGMGPDGKQIKKTKTVKAASEREAEKLLAEFVTEVEKGLFIAPAKLTFKEFTEQWLSNYAEKELAPKTVSRYKELLESRIFPAMGHLKIKDIKPMHLLEFYKNLAEDGLRLDGKPGKLSESTIRHHHRLISSILQKAVEWEVIPANPARRVKAPKSKRKQAAVYDEQQVKALLAAADREPVKRKVLIYLAVFSGLRRGEIMGLEWLDINFEEGTLSVRQVAQYVPGKGRFLKDPKNEFSVRTISLPSFVMDMLKQLKVHQAKVRLQAGDLWEDSGRVFVRWDGRPLSPEWPSSWFSQFLEKHGLPHIPFHGLRHTAATLLINQGLPAKSISSRLGHSNIHTTMDIYGHWLKSADKEAAERLEQLYNGRLKNSGAVK